MSVPVAEGRAMVFGAGPLSPGALDRSTAAEALHLSAVRHRSTRVHRPALRHRGGGAGAGEHGFAVPVLGGEAPGHHAKRVDHAAS